jgi:DUF4097 and DUF4098 domain-containing protein YvlB
MESSTMRPVKRLTLLLAAATLAACYAPEHHQATYRQEWEAAQIKRVEVRGTNGRIEVEAAPTDRIQMEARIRTRKGTEENQLKELIVVKLEGTTLVIREKGAGRSMRFLGFGKGNRQVDFSLVIPAQIELTATTVNGRVEVDGMAAPMTLSSVNGRIELSTPGATVHANTVNGSIRAEFQQRFVGAKFSTVNGSIGVEVPQNSSLDLDIHQVNGSFRTDLPVVVESTGGRGSHGSLHGGEFPLQINTVNGSVRLRQADPPVDVTRG